MTDSKIKIGIFFGGSSREREVSFAGGRTVFDNLDKSLFEPVLLFIDSFNRFIEIDWHYIYKGSIRDFYPPVNAYPSADYPFQLYAESLPDLQSAEHPEIGRLVRPDELADIIDMAFLTLHGTKGEDGTLQGLLEWYGIPYTGEGIYGSSFGINKAIQKKFFKNTGLPSPDYFLIERSEWEKDPKQVFQSCQLQLKNKVVVKPASQGSSVGVSIIPPGDYEQFEKAVNQAFFKSHWKKSIWQGYNEEEKQRFLIRLTDIRTGIGFPLDADGEVVYDPLSLWQQLDNTEKEELWLESVNVETQVIIETYIAGREFSCIVIEDKDGKPFALPPTEIKKGSEVFDYRSKYLPGMSRKQTPIHADAEQIRHIRKSCAELFTLMQSQVYCRIDGFLTADGEVYLNDPNTTSGMLPSSFFFHQAAEAGMNPSQFLTYIVLRSLDARIRQSNTSGKAKFLKSILSEKLHARRDHESEKPHVAVVLGGYSAERHISVESGRNIFEKLFSAGKYEPLPFFLTEDKDGFAFHELPPRLLLKDNADDIRDKLYHDCDNLEWRNTFRDEAFGIASEVVSHPNAQSRVLRLHELKEYVDFVFIALHGRPGEDGRIQQALEEAGLPYNGSGVSSSQLTINKYETNELLKKHGFHVARHALIEKTDEVTDTSGILYPLIAKPVDDGCSAAVKKIENADMLEAYRKAIFRDSDVLDTQLAHDLGLKPNEEFPVKDQFLIESLITREKSSLFFEITGGLMTDYAADGTLQYEVFEASEALATAGVLSLEEKFLAGEGQNITPARYHSDPEKRQRISEKVKEELRKVAEAVGVEGYARIDAFVRIYDDEDVEVVIIEINSLPGMTPATVIFHQAALQGYKPHEFIHKIIEFGFKRLKKNAATIA